MGMLVLVKDWEFFRIKKTYRMELSTSKILEDNMFQFAFYQTPGDEFTFLQAIT
jgi:hypothetical protein